MTSSHDYGRTAEQQAADYLERHGWTVLHRNWRWRHKEIDLIARRADLIAFVEVKARHRTAYGHPLHSLTWSKRRDLAAAARAWVSQHGQPADSYRFDVVWVLGDRDPPQHEEGAWVL